jgi:hypothetical protein
MLLALALHASTAHAGTPAGFGGTPGFINERTPHYDLEPLYHDGKGRNSAPAPVCRPRALPVEAAPLGRRHPGRPLSQQQAAAVPLTLRVGDG